MELNSRQFLRTGLLCAAAGNVLAYIFMRVDGQHPRRSLGALRLERATRAITTVCAIDQYAIAAIKRERQGFD